MDLTLWSVFTWFAKWAGYLGMAAAVGGSFSLLLLFRRAVFSDRILIYITLGCGAGAFAAVAGFFIQVGAFADQGIPGMFDSTYAAILWQSNVGLTALTKIIGFSLVATGLLFYRRKIFIDSFWARNVVSHGLMIFGIGVLAISFQYEGHTTGANGFARVAVVFHVIAMGLWVGSLYPLWLACRTSAPGELQKSMVRFGNIAAGFVGILALCGILLMFFLIDDIAVLTSTAYGWSLLTKLALVLFMFLIAACNKWVWVPRLAQQNSVRNLRRTIGLETSVALTILAITAFFTTIVGLPH